MKSWIKKNKEVVLYLFFGVCTTMVNIIVYAVATRLFWLEVVQATILAWVLSVVFAYITNRKYVFDSSAYKPKEVIVEVCNFFGCRFFSGVLDIFLMWILVDVAGLPDIVIKIVSNIIVIVLNYVASKFWIFKRKK